ncbi:uncharacterized protein LOC127770043 [Oryza glaberrima]|uniref:uncharacterized protein LOC127770043 n=1 Tax=Oryza glaberrima TaxID=4538 RepID=UPI00224C4DD9|nr:uncharacterized protein LOC127770043 [Oryza glaberrima]
MAQPATSSRSSGDFPADWVFLDTVAHAGRCRRDNATTTTARARSSDGHPIEVSFALADPPALTRCLVHCPAGLTAGEFSRSPPSVAAADGAFLLLRVVFPHRSDRCMATDWFVYRQPGPAGAPPPSLELLVQRPNPLDVVSRHAAVLSRGDHCLVVDPEWGFHDDDDDDGDDRRRSSSSTCISSRARPSGGAARSRSWAAAPWRRSTLSSSPPRCCASSEEDQWPGSISGTASYCSTRSPGTPPRNDGWFKFIEMGFPHLDPNDARLNRGWEATMFKRRIIRSDDDCYRQWEPCGTVDSASLLLPAADSCVPDCLFPEIFDYEERKLALNNVLSSFPTLDLYRDDVVYMMTKIKDDDPDGWIIAVNTESKRLEGISPFSQESYHLHRIYQQCDFSKHLINKALGTHLAKDMDKLMDQQAIC